MYRLMTTGWQGAETDQDGFYRIAGMYASSDAVSVILKGYKDFEKVVTISGDTRFDISLVRR